MGSDFGESVKSSDRRAQLEAIRDYLVHELEVNRCNTCMASKLRTGDTAALVLRLMKVLEEIEQLPKQDGTVSELDAIRARKSARTSAATNSSRSSKSGESGA